MSSVDNIGRMFLLSLCFLLYDRVVRKAPDSPMRVFLLMKLALEFFWGQQSLDVAGYRTESRYHHECHEKEKMYSHQSNFFWLRELPRTMPLFTITEQILAL